MNQPKNNLFALAYKELSQDAFFAWLFNFANPVYKNSHEQLHDCAVSLLQKWLGINIDIATIEVKTQETFSTEDKENENVKRRNAIDLFIIINKNTYLIIESKTNSSLHSNQLERYTKHAKENYKNFTGIYLKTGNESNYVRANIHPAFKAITRQDLLEHFNSYKDSIHKDGIRNDIFIDFVENLQDIENQTNSFEQSSPENWEWRQWEGFYQKLDNLNLLEDWFYVDRRSGGFLAADFKGKQWQSKHGEYKILFAVHEKQLVFGIFLGDTNKQNNKDKSIKREVRDEFAERLPNAAKDKFLKITKPKRLGMGKFTRVAFVDKYWLDDAGNYIGIDEMIKKMKQYHEFLLSL
ncbi:PD-(D/E)XK nuclease family protein [Moraxella sp. ZJ142]|uniref:PD-(D/E)XK nuclease family protein n=1 Tax=Moraxella marmotae TaxID=3344520 RepID=UPI0035D49645